VPLASEKPAGNVNVKAGVELNVNATVGMNATKSSGVSCEVPIARGKRLEDCSVGVTDGWVASNCALTLPLPLAATGTVRLAVCPAIVPSAAVVGTAPTGMLTAAAVETGVGAVVGVTVGGTADPPPPHAQSKAAITNATPRNLLATSAPFQTNRFGRFDERLHVCLLVGRPRFGPASLLRLRVFFLSRHFLYVSVIE
jgi:hypothetical protein